MTSLRRRVTGLVAAFSAIILAACSDPSRIGAPSALEQTAGSASLAEDVRAAIAAQERHTSALMRTPGVLGTAVGLLPTGRATVQVFVLDDTPRNIPAALDAIPVTVRTTGRLMALSDPRTRMRPAPIGFSVGHPLITAGTIGARVVSAAGAVYALSNNHVLANSNDAAIGDATLQPGPYDGGTSADQVGTLAAFRAIDFSGGSNLMDAAIALTTTANIGNATPLDDGYGLPDSRILGDANGDRVFDDKTQLLGVYVQKYGRTTKLTKGRITGINATVDICYEVLIIFCVKSARFTDQVVMGQSGFSGGGDSGSLIVTDNAARNPVALLFAGSSTETIANRIDLVLNHFDVSIDGTASEPPPPPDPVTDAQLVGINAASSIEQGSTVFVGAVVRNAGNQPIGAFDVTMVDQTDGVAIGTATVASLAVGATESVVFSWNTASSSIGSHTLTATHTLADDNAANNAASTSVQVTDADLTGIHVGDLDGWSQNDGSSWSATVEVTIHDATHAPLNGATITGTWSVAGLNSNTCTSGELGGTGTCIMLFPGLKKGTKSVTFTVTSATMSARTYLAGQNHDPDGSSTGTSQVVARP